MDKKFITFFHTSPHYIQLFFPQHLKRPLFYWFGDCYHDMIGGDNREDYFYLFVKNPREDNISFRSRTEEMGFDGIYRHYLEYQKNRVEPAILMSFSKIIPDLALKYDQKYKAYAVITPIEHKGTKINFHDENGKPKNFLEIPEILAIVPNIKNSHPFIDPIKKDGKYAYRDWIPMITEKMGTWL